MWTVLIYCNARSCCTTRGRHDCALPPQYTFYNIAHRRLVVDILLAVDESQQGSKCGLSWHRQGTERGMNYLRWYYSSTVTHITAVGAVSKVAETPPLHNYGLSKHLVNAFEHMPNPTRCPRPRNDVRLPIGVLQYNVQPLQIGLHTPALCRRGEGAATCNHSTDITVGAVLRSEPTSYLAKQLGQMNDNRVGAGVSAIDVPSPV